MLLSRVRCGHGEEVVSGELRSRPPARSWLFTTFTRALSTACILFALQGELSLIGFSSWGMTSQGAEEEPGAAGERIKEEIDTGKLRDLGFVGLPGYPCIPDLVQVVGQEGADGLWAASFLARNQCKSLAGSVVHLVEHKSAGVRRTVAELLGHLGGREAEAGIETLLEDQDDAVRAAAVRASCETAPDRCGPKTLQRALADPSPQVRAAATDAITAVGYVIPVGKASQLLSDSSPKVVERALAGLPCNLLDNNEITPLLRTLAHATGDSLVSSAAIVAMGRCRVTAACDTLIDILFSLPPDEVAPSSQVRSVVAAIGQCCERSGRKPLEEFVSSRATPAEMRRITMSNVQSAREVAIGILEKAGASSSLPALRAALGDPYYRVRLAALRAADTLGLTCALKVDISRILDQDDVMAVRVEATAQIARARCPGDP